MPGRGSRNSSRVPPRAPPPTPPPVSTTFQVGTRELEKLIPPFDPEWKSNMESTQWIEVVNTICDKYNVPDEVKLLQATLKLQGPARNWMLGCQHELTTWDDFVAALIENFPARINTTDIHRKLDRRRQGQHESATAYYFDQLGLAKRISLSVEETMSYIIRGCRSERARNSLASNRYDTLPELLQAMRRIEDSEGKDERRASERTRHNSPSATGRRSRREYTRHRGSDQGRRGREDRSRSDFRDRDDRRSRRNSPRRKRQHSPHRDRSPRKTTKEENDRDEPPKKVRRCFICQSTEHLLKKCPQQKDFRKRVVHATTTRQNKKSYKVISIHNKEYTALVDLGSECTVMREDVRKELGITIGNPKIIIVAYGGGTIRALGCSTQKIMIDGLIGEITVHVVDSKVQPEPFLLGNDFFYENKFKVVTTSEGIEIVESKMDTEIPERVVRKLRREPLDESDVKIGSNIKERDKCAVKDLISEYRRCFAKDTKELGLTKLENLKIELTDTRPVRYAAYRVPYAYKEGLRTLIKELLEAGIIEKSKSEYASPVVVHQKKEGDIRMCVDFRKLNECIRKEYYPSPVIEEELNKLSGKKVFSSLDLSKGYYQIEVHPDSRKYTAFITTEGQFQFTRVPFGLCNSPAVFMRIMAQVLEPIESDNVIYFMDDVLVATNTVAEQLEILRAIFEQLSKHNLTLNPQKCQFLEKQLTFLGHEVSSTGISPGNHKTKAVEEFKRPNSKKGVRRFLGLVGFFRRFIPNFAAIAIPLTRLTKAATEFKWDEDHEKAFVHLKKALVCHPILTPFNTTATHEVHCDGCKVGIGGVLLQKEGDGILKPVAYFSRALSDGEKKYGSYIWETMAIVESLKRFKYYLLGRHFVIYTDCNSLKQTHYKRRIEDMITRWWFQIMEFDFEIKYRPGDQMCHVDALSRHPPDRDGDFEEDQEEETRFVGNLYTENEDWVVAMQLRDQQTSRYKDILEGKLEGESEENQVRKDYESVDGRIFAKTKQGLRFFVPRGVRYNVMHSVHNEMGHRGVTSCLTQLRKDYWWPRMRKDVKKYVEKCLSCKLSKPGEDERHHRIYMVEKKPIPFFVIHVDYCGPFEDGKKKGHVFAIVDAFTRFCILRTSSSPTARNAIKAIKEISQYFGMPAIIVCDQGAAFESKEFKDFCEEYGIKRSPVAVSTPRANGQAERMFRTVTGALRSLEVEQTGKTWSQNISAVQWALNSYQNRVTGESPQMLLMGYRPRNILKNKLQDAIAHTVNKRENPELLTEIREAALRRMTEFQADQAEKHNMLGKEPREYKIGDLVLCKWHAPSTGTTRKLLPRYRGPYIVEDVVGRDRYLIKDTPLTQVTQIPYENICAADRLKPWANDGELEGLDGIDSEGEVEGPDDIDSGDEK